MAMRDVSLVEGEIYHICNRGIDKRIIFEDVYDLCRFVQGMIEFNDEELIGSLYENSFTKNDPIKLGRLASKSKLVTIISFCLNPNHFHLILRQEVEEGIKKFIHRLCTGYSKYFNNKYKRSGSLFGGKFKARHINTNEYLLHVSAYVNLNDRVHQLGRLASKLGEDGPVESWSSWSEYAGGDLGHAQKRFGLICEPEIILAQFPDKNGYKTFAESSLEISLEKKQEAKEANDTWLE